MKVLIVEDGPAHMADAVRAAHDLGLVEVVKATEAEDAICKMGSVDAMVTDIYIPFRGDEKMEEWPWGVLVAARARYHGLPVALCTAGFHHGVRYEFVSRLLTMGLQWHDDAPIFDVQPEFPTREAPEADRKPWRAALRHVMKMTAEGAK